MGRQEEAAGQHILVVEDEYLIMSDLTTAVEAEGARVIGPTASLAEALRLAANAPRIDGAVLDINLQGEMVYPLADMLEERGIPFVFATGYDDGAIPQRYAKVKRFQKPFDPAQVVCSLTSGAKHNRNEIC